MCIYLYTHIFDHSNSRPLYLCRCVWILMIRRQNPLCFTRWRCSHDQEATLLQNHLCRSSVSFSAKMRVFNSLTEKWWSSLWLVHSNLEKSISFPRANFGSLSSSESRFGLYLWFQPDVESYVLVHQTKTQHASRSGLGFVVMSWPYWAWFGCKML